VQGINLLLSSIAVSSQNVSKKTLPSTNLICHSAERDTIREILSLIDQEAADLSNAFLHAFDKPGITGTQNLSSTKIPESPGYVRSDEAHSRL
jgi:hypothetical protein